MTDAEKDIVERLLQRVNGARKMHQSIYADEMQAAADTITTLRAEVERLTALTAAWAPNGDETLPEDTDIAAVHPVKTGDHAGYMEAMRLVGAKRSKGALVDLVHWLLTFKARADKAEADRDAAIARAEKAEAAIRWALGEVGEFEPRGEYGPPYWWRPKLRALASLTEGETE